MAQRRSNDESELLEALERFLFVMPYWVGPAVALLTYSFFRFLVPFFVPDTEDKAVTVIANLARSVAPYSAAIVIIIWLFAELKKFGRRRLLDSRPNIESLASLSWQEFEHLIGEAFRRRGYIIEETGGGGADGGVDLRLRKDGATTIVQVKQWKNSQVGVATVRELYGVMAAENADHGIVVCIGRFTKEAHDFACNIPIKLIEGEELWKMIAAVRTESPTQGKREGLADDKPQRDVAEFPKCPQCGASMVLRKATRGKHAGSEFYGCSEFPKCRGTREC